MEFTNLLTGTHCTCLNRAQENTSTIFIKRIDKQAPIEKDFKSYHDRGKLPTSEDDCEQVCSLRDVSINIWTEESKRSVIEKYKNTKLIAPAHKRIVCVFTFKKDAGLVKPTPEPDDPYHYSFFKCNTFTLDHINVKEVNNVAAIDNVLSGS